MSGAALPQAWRRGGTLARFVLLGGASLGSGVLGFLLVIVIVRSGGAGVLGELSFGLTVLGYALVVGTLGTEYQAIRLAAAPGADKPALAASVILLRLAVAVPLYAGIVLAAIWWPPLAPYREVLAVLGLSLFLNAGNLIWLLQAGTGQVGTAIGNLLPALFAMLLALAVAAAHLGAAAFAAGKVAADLLSVCVIVVLVRRQLLGLDWRAGWRGVRGLAIVSAPVGGSQMLRGLALSSDMIVLGLLVSPVALGHYSAAFRVFGLLLSLGTIYHVLLIPIFSRSAESVTLLRREARRGAAATLAVAVPLLLVIGGPAGFWMALGFGPDFAAAGPALQLLAAAALLNAVARPYRQVLLTLGRQREDLRLNAASTVVHVALKPGLCWWLGPAGVALGTLLGEAALLVMTRRAVVRSMSGGSSGGAGSP